MAVPKKGSLLILIGLYVLTIPFFNALNVTAYDNSQILGHFGASTTVFAYSSYIPVFAMLAFIPLGLKIGKQIPIKTLILSACFLSIFFNTASLYCQNIFWFTLWRSLIAIVSVTGIFASLLPIVLKYNPTFNMAIMYGIIQFIQKGSQQLYQYWGAKFISFYDWTFGIYFLNVNFMVCILLAWLFYKSDVIPMKEKFQFDWRGWFLMILFLLMVLILTVEGQSLNWWSDTRIGIVFASMVLLIGLYFIHVRYTELPILNPDVFKYKSVVFGSFLFFYTGIMNGTGSIVTGFMTRILGFDGLAVAQAHLPILIGIIISVPLATYLLFKRIYMSTIWIAGFACYGLYHIILFFRFYPGIEAADFFVPLMFKGLGMGFLYPASALYISEGVPKHLGDSRMLSGIFARVVFATLLGGAFLETITSNTIALHKTGISQQLNPTNEMANKTLTKDKKTFLYLGLSETEAKKMAEKKLLNQTVVSATLLAYKDIYLVMSAICFIPIFVILLFKLGRRPLGRVEVEPIPL